MKSRSIVTYKPAEAKPFKKTPIQCIATRLLAAVDSFAVMLYGGSRSGKTFIIVRSIILRAFKYPGSRHLMLRLHFQHAKTSLWHDTIPKVFKTCFPNVRVGGAGQKNIDVVLNKQDWFIEFSNGSQIWLGGLDDKERVEKILGTEYCVDPDSRILCSDLRWRKARNVEIGRELIAFPEKLDGHIKLQASRVTGKREQQAEKYRITTDRGSTVVSANHKFVSLYDDRRKRDFSMLSWRRAKELRIGDVVRFSIIPWKTGKEVEDGWMSGILDGEGSAGLGLGVGQNEGAVLNKMIAWFHSHKVKYTTYASKNKSTGKTCVSLNASGMWQGLRLLGITRPVRLKSRKMWENRRAFTSGGFEAVVTNIEKLGVGNVIAFQTSTKTLIHDGFLGHNCTMYFNECSQLSWTSVKLAITRLAQVIPGCRKKLLFDCNPPNKRHWTYSLWIKHQDPESGHSQPNPRLYSSMRMNPADNEENLGEDYVTNVLNGTLNERELKRFRDGEFLDDAEGALFKYSDLNKNRIPLDKFDKNRLDKVVIAVDPAVSNNEDSDSHGIVAIGWNKETDDEYVLEDATMPGTPRQWAMKVVEMWQKWDADLVIGEINQGGDLVETNLRTVSQTMPFKMVRATKGKAVRAEPVASMSERGKLHMVGEHPMLEEELTSWVPDIGMKSPNRMDAMVWGCSHFIKSKKRAGLW